MNKKPFIFIAACMVAIGALCLFTLFNKKPKEDHTGSETTPEPGMVFVALQPQEGVTITSENPLSVVPGASAVFTVEPDAKHYIMPSDKYSCSGNEITFENITNSCTLYITLGEYYKITINNEGMGETTTEETAFLKKDDTVTLTFTPNEGYFLKTVKVNGLYQEPDSENTLTITINGDTLLDVVYEEIPAPPKTLFDVYIVKGMETISLGESLAPGTAVTLPLGDETAIKASEYGLIGYNTAADYSGEFYALGSVIPVGHEDIALYPQEYKYAEAADFTVTNNGAGYMITGYTGTPLDGVVCIPPYINGLPVTDVSANAFSSVSGLVTLIFPIGMKNIADGSITDCPDFTTLVLPQTIESFTSKAVANCPSFKNFRVIATIEPRFKNSFDSVLADKFLRLQSTEGKRIILVSGSSSCYGLSSQMLIDAFPEYDVVNFSSSYLNGMHISLQLLSSFIHEGDIVILAPEYYSSTYAGSDPVQTATWHSLESNLNMLNYLDMSSYSAIMDSFAEAMGIIRSYAASGKYHYANSISRRSSFNEYGDLTSVRPINNSKVFTSFPSVVSNRGMNIINSYVDEFTEKGATCLFSFPLIYVKNITDTLTEGSATHLTRLSTKLTANCAIISDPMDYAITENLFYDNYYHATLEGAAYRTEQLIKDLQAYFQR